MFRHVVMFVFVEGVTEAQIRAIGEGLAALPEAIPEIVEYRFGPDAGLAEDNHDYVVVADFGTADGYLVYRDHPAHQELIVDLIRPAMAERVAVQYQVD